MKEGKRGRRPSQGGPFSDNSILKLHQQCYFYLKKHIRIRFYTESLSRSSKSLFFVLKIFGTNAQGAFLQLKNEKG